MSDQYTQETILNLINNQDMQTKTPVRYCLTSIDNAKD